MKDCERCTDTDACECLECEYNECCTCSTYGCLLLISVPILIILISHAIETNWYKLVENLQPYAFTIAGIGMFSILFTVSLAYLSSLNNINNRFIKLRNKLKNKKYVNKLYKKYCEEYEELETFYTFECSSFFRGYYLAELNREKYYRRQYRLDKHLEFLNKLRER